MHTCIRSVRRSMLAKSFLLSVFPLAVRSYISLWLQSCAYGLRSIVADDYSNRKGWRAIKLSSNYQKGKIEEWIALKWKGMKSFTFSWFMGLQCSRLLPTHTHKHLYGKSTSTDMQSTWGSSTITVAASFSTSSQDEASTRPLHITAGTTIYTLASYSTASQYPAGMWEECPTL